jgi:hypothetical protein
MHLGGGRNVTSTRSKLGQDFLLFQGDLLLKAMAQYSAVSKHIMAENIGLARSER